MDPLTPFGASLLLYLRMKQAVHTETSFDFLAMSPTNREFGKKPDSYLLSIVDFRDKI